MAADAFPELPNQPVTSAWCMHTDTLQSYGEKTAYRMPHILSLLLVFAKLNAEIVIISPITSPGKERKRKHSPFFSLTAKELTVYDSVS